MSLNEPDHQSELLQLLDELDRLAEEQRIVDTRDPDALTESERKLDAIRHRIHQLKVSRVGPSGVIT